MLYGARPSNAHRDPSGKMGYNLSIKRSSNPQQNSKIAKETVHLTQANQSLNHQDKLKAKRCIHKPCGDLPHELKKHANEGNLVQRETSENCRQHPVTVKAKDDELVRYMSNLPGYLQRVESIQDKAMNVGVLDWGRLENWTCNQKGAPFGIGNNSSLSCSNLSTKITTGSSAFSSPTRNAYGNKQHPSISCTNNSSHNVGDSRNAKSYSRDSMHFQDIENATKSQFDGQKRAAWNYRSFGRNSSNATSEKGKRREFDHKITSNVEHQPSNFKYDRMPIGPKESVNAYYDRVTKKGVEQLEGSDIRRKASKQNFTPSVGTSSSKFENYDSSIIKEKKNANDSGTKKRIELPEPATYLPPQHKVDEKKNIVLLVPRKFSQSSSLKQTRMSLDENVIGANQNSLTEGFCDKESFSSELHREIPHSCPLPSRAETGTEQEMAADAISIQDAEVSYDAINKSTRGNLNETSKKLEQETEELAARKGRHPSPSRRFSLSLSRMTRSFSFKESSAVPHLSSTYVSVKSGPVTSNAFAGIDNSNKGKASCHNRARSSPLRRILDPLLLKPKGLTSSYSTEIDQSLQGTLNSYSFKPIKVTESLQNEKHEESSIQAQLVLTTSNGFPLFRFFINDNIIVAAPAKNIMPLEKNDPSCNYVLYTIDGNKKKSGSWINQGSKEKRCGFVYNVVGQMKVNSTSSLDLSGKDSNSQYMVKESVLYGVDLRQADQASPQLMPNTELAAVVFEMPKGKEGYDMQHSDKESNVKERGFSWCLPENEQKNSCTVILPGGIHSLPNTGVPSSLIHRWKSGGSCDCGGWDVGCKLRSLSNATQHQKLSKTYYDCLLSDCFKLFVQGDAQQDRPIFSMAPFEKGKYSVEFSASISSLQAFFICVSVISCQRLSDLPEVGSLSIQKALQESSTVNDGPKTIWTTALKEAPVKYTPSPPVSPVGRA